MQNRLTNSQRYLVVGLGLPLTVTIRVSAMVSASTVVNLSTYSAYMPKKGGEGKEKGGGREEEGMAP